MGATNKYALFWYRKKSIRLFVLFLFLISFSWLVVADSSMSLSTHYYYLKPGLSITKPILAYENRLSLDTTIHAKLTVDRVVTDYEGYDSISSASQYQGDLTSDVDTRQEYVIAGSTKISSWEFSTGYLFSSEKDYLSHSLSMSMSKDFNRRNTTLALGYAHNFDSVNGRYMSATKAKNVDNVSLAVTQVLSPVSLIQLGYTFQDNRGFLSTGNRQIVLDNDIRYPEYLPSTRLRQAVGIRFAHWLPSKTALHIGYRRYQDDWELYSNTYEFKAYQAINKQWQIRGEFRLYYQSSVYFMKDAYDGTERFLTSASSLKSFASRLYGLGLSYKPKTLSDTAFQFKFEKYLQDTGVSGNIVMFNAKMVY